METLNYVLDTPLIKVSEFRELVNAMQHYVEIVNNRWSLPDIKITHGKKVLDGSWNVIIGERGRVSNEYGRHDFLNGKPIAYVSPEFCGVTKNSYGRETAIFGAYTPPSKNGDGILYPGLASVLSHETAEMLVDPNPIQDGKWVMRPDNTKILVEVGDQANVLHTHLHIVTKSFGRKKLRDVVVSGITLPGYYGLAPTAYTWPASRLFNEPFIEIPGCYGAIKDINGNVTVKDF